MLILMILFHFSVPQRLRNIYIDVSNNTDGSSAQTCVFDNQPYKSSETRVYSCPSHLKGRYVRIGFIPTYRQNLQICEVQVQGIKNSIFNMLLRVSVAYF